MFIFILIIVVLIIIIGFIIMITGALGMLLSVLIPPIILWSIAIVIAKELHSNNPPLSIIPIAIALLLTIGYCTKNPVYNFGHQATWTANVAGEIIDNEQMTMCKSRWNASEGGGNGCPCDRNADCYEEDGQACIFLWDANKESRPSEGKCYDNENLARHQSRRPYLKIEISE